MAGLLAGGHPAAATFAPSELTLILLLGLAIGALWKRFVLVAAVLVGLYLVSRIPKVSFPADAVLVLVLVFAFVGFLFGGRTMLRNLGQSEHLNRFTNIQNNVNGIWGRFFGGKW